MHLCPGTTLARHPLTSSQREIWFEQALHADLPLYNIGGYLELPGPLDVALFKRSIHLLVQHHDALRLVLTGEQDEEGLPMQVFVDPWTVEVPVRDFSSAPNPLETALAWMPERFVQPFALIGQPLFRYDLVKLGGGKYYWLVQYHHLIIDSWGAALLNRSQAAIYADLVKGRTPNLESPSYVGFIASDRDYIASGNFEKNRKYWLNQFPSPRSHCSPHATLRSSSAARAQAVANRFGCHGIFITAWKPWENGTRPAFFLCC